MGIADSALGLLRSQFRAALGKAPAGSNLNLQLMLAGERADPAFPANEGPIVAWANAIWEATIPTRQLEQAWAHFSRLQPKWSEVNGPTGAMLATCRRIGWRAPSWHMLETDEGLAIDCREASPGWVRRMVRQATVA